MSWANLRDGAGPIEALAARGVVPLDYSGMALALREWLHDGNAATEWFRTRPEALERLQAIRASAEHNELVRAREFLGIPYKNTLKGNSQELAVFRYRRSGSRQSNLVLIDTSVHRDPRTAVERALGPVVMLEPATESVRDSPGAEQIEVIRNWFDGLWASAIRPEIPAWPGVDDALHPMRVAP
jgi:hypothetical protein